MNSKVDTLENIRINIEEQYSILLKNTNFLQFANLKQHKHSPYFDILVKFSKKTEDREIIQIKKEILNLLKKAESLVDCKNNLETLRELYKEDDQPKYFITNYYAKETVTDLDTLKISELVLKIEKIIPSYLKKKEMSILLTKSGKSFLNQKNNQICININQSEENIISEIFHEIGHALELQNPTLFQESVLFLSKKTKTGAILRENTNYGRFVHPYTGTVYAWNSTEVLSLGLQLMYLNPIMFLFRDPTHFEFIDSVLRKGI